MTADVDPSVPPSGIGCAECDAVGSWWVHLRRCAACGHIGCCDDSLARHATAHWRESGHPIIRSFEPGEDWFWDYASNDYYQGPELAPPQCHPLDQTAPGPRGRGAAQTGPELLGQYRRQGQESAGEPRLPLLVLQRWVGRLVCPRPFGVKSRKQLTTQTGSRGTCRRGRTSNNRTVPTCGASRPRRVRTRSGPGSVRPPAFPRDSRG